MPNGGGGTSSTVTTQELSPEQRKLLNLAMPELEGYAQTDLKQYPGSAITPFNQTQTAARDELAKQAVGTVKPLASRAITTARSLQDVGTAGGAAGAGTALGAGAAGAGGLQQVLDDYSAGAGTRAFLQSGALLDPKTNPVLKEQTRLAIKPIRQELNREILPGIASDYVGNNMFGSSRQGIAEGMAIEDFLTKAGDISTELQMNAFNQGLGAMLSSSNAGVDAATSAVGSGLGAGTDAMSSLFSTAIQSLTASPELAELSFLPAMTLEGIGQSQQSMQQALLDEKINRYTTEQMLPYLKAQDIANLAFGMGGGSAVAESNQNAAFNPAQTAIGAGMGLYSLMSMLPMLGASDRRLKENIKFIGVNTFGTKFYEFTFKDDPAHTVHRGVMSDEVPHAVVGQVDGFDVVDYSMV